MTFAPQHSPFPYLPFPSLACLLISYLLAQPHIPILTSGPA